LRFLCADVGNFGLAFEPLATVAQGILQSFLAAQAAHSFRGTCMKANQKHAATSDATLPKSEEWP